MALLFLLFALGVAAAEHSSESHDDDGEYGHYTTWRRAICEKKSTEMYKEMMECFQMNDKRVIETTDKCAEYAVPSSKGDIIAFMDVACVEHQTFRKFDECFEELEEDPEFEKLLEPTPEMEACYDRIFEKYAVDTLKGDMKNFSSEEDHD